MAQTRSTRGFVLAGGQSRRMGRDKALLPWGDGTLLDHMVGLLAQICDRVDVVGRGALPDCIPGNGPLGGILTALETTDVDDNLIVAVDLPLLEVAFLRWFHRRFEESSNPVVGCRLEHRVPLVLGIRRTALPKVRNLVASGHLSVHDFVFSANADLLDAADLAGAGFTSRLFENVNASEDWDRLRFSAPQ